MKADAIFKSELLISDPHGWVHQVTVIAVRQAGSCMQSGFVYSDPHVLMNH